MLENIDYKVNRHANFRLIYNLVVEVFEKKKIINNDIETELKKIIIENFKKHKCILNRFEVENANMLVLNFDAPPQIQLSKLVNNLKTVSSRRIRKKFLIHIKHNGLEEHLWELKYYISTCDVKIKE